VLAVKEVSGARTHREFIEAAGLQARDYYRWISEDQPRAPSFKALMRLLDYAGVPLPSGKEPRESDEMAQVVERLEALAERLEKRRSGQAPS